VKKTSGQTVKPSAEYSIAGFSLARQLTPNTNVKALRDVVLLVILLLTRNQFLECLRIQTIPGAKGSYVG